MPDEPRNDSSLWSSWPLVVLIIILVAIALVDGLPRLSAFLHSLGVL